MGPAKSVITPFSQRNARWSELASTEFPTVWFRLLMALAAAYGWLRNEPLRLLLLVCGEERASANRWD